MKKTFLLILAKIFSFVFIFCILFNSVSAIGLVTQPIIIEDSLRGVEYQEKLIIVNSEEKINKIELTSAGQIKDWVSFFTINDPETAITEIEIPARANMEVVSVFTIPEDVANGEYKGTIGVLTKPIDSGDKKESYSNVNQEIDNEVKIIVTDDEIVNLDVSIIPGAYDLASGDPLDIRFIYDNQGNVRLSPQIDLKILKEENVVYNVIYPYPEEKSPVRAGSQQEIPAISVPTNNLEEGKYLVEMKFLHKGESILDKKFSFSIDNDIKVLGWTGEFKDLNWGDIAIKSLYILVILSIIIIIFSLYKSKKLNKQSNK